MWREDDPPCNGGCPRKSHLWRRFVRLERMNKKRPGKFQKQLEIAEKEFEEERRRVALFDSL